jgi:hypothetical protein
MLWTSWELNEGLVRRPKPSTISGMSGRGRDIHEGPGTGAESPGWYLQSQDPNPLRI